LIEQASIGTMPDEARLSVAALDRALRELAVVPRTGDELRWVESLHAAQTQNQEWWSQTAQAVSRLSPPQRNDLELRHLEALRWASLASPEYLTQSREDLLSTLLSRLDGRAFHKRSAEKMVLNAPRKEKLADWQSMLSWGDLLAMAVLDDALASESLRSRLFEQVEVDRIDRTTEYGGIIDTHDGTEYRTVLYRPRARDRRSDTEFVASDDMVRASDRALAHYHMHVQRVSNTEYAGPSEADLEYASSSGRMCVVFTSVDETRLNVDCYFPGGIVVDMGTIARPSR
jgi:hypothetical protein